MVEIKPMGQELVEQLYKDLEGKWHKPATFTAWAFLVTEVAEVGDVLLRQGHLGIFARNHEKPSGREELIKELGDTYLMLCALANTLDVDLNDALDMSIHSIMNKHGGNLT